MIKVRPTDGVRSKWFQYWFLSPGGRAEISKVASSTSGLYTLSISKVAALPLPLASVTEQDRIIGEVERRLSVIENLETTIDEGLRRAGQLRQAILKQAFSGRLVPQDPTEEPASDLLARIRAERHTPAKPLRPSRATRRRSLSRQLSFDDAASRG